MRKRTLFINILFLIPVVILPQNLSIRNLTLDNIETSIVIDNVPEGLKILNLKVIRDPSSEEYNLSVLNGKVDTVLTFKESGKYTLTFEKLGLEKGITVIPGWLSIVPPLLAIFLALVLRQVIVAMAAGIYLGTIFIYDYNPLIALLRMSDTIMMDAIVDKEHMYINIFTLLIGGVVGIISRNGGTIGLASEITKFARSAKSGLLSSWGMGMFIFFDDYANTLIMGNMMRPITDKLRISREKLAYIVDSTSAPIASIAIISTWIGYELGLISEGLNAIGSAAKPYEVFIQTLPYRFYPIAALFFVFISSYARRDFGPMLKAERRAALEGILYENGSISRSNLDEFEEMKIEKPRWYNGVIPIMIILFGTLTGLFYTGMLSLNEQGITDYSVQNIISNSDSYLALLWASLTAGTVAIFMTVYQRILSLNDSINAWIKGIQSMLFACIILVFAWAISTITYELMTADYLISILKDSINPFLMPALVFLVCALISFSTGSSWGTMAIVMPIVIPLASKICSIASLAPEQTEIIVIGTVSSVLTGSVFGDHCSPIADTTILSSMASRCNHIDHVKTQLPYAVIIAAVCILLGDLPTAFGMNPYISLGLIAAVLTLIIYFFGKKVPDPDSDNL